MLIYRNVEGMHGHKRLAIPAPNHGICLFYSQYKHFN